MTRVRFIAPASGGLQVTGARVALANAAFAKRYQARFLLRAASDDDRIVPDLRWLGVTWNAIGEVHDRTAAIAHLKSIGRLYPCFESETELKAKREFRLRRGQPAIYDRAMLKLTPEQRAAAEAGGKIPHWRLRLSNRVVTWTDAILGARESKLSALSDPVLVAADGDPSPMLAAVIDDIADGITHVIRADEGDGTTGIQIDLLSALGIQPDVMTFANMPALADTGRLAIRALRNDGIDPETIVHWLGLNGRFNWRRLADKPDPVALPAFNRPVLATRDFAAVADRLPPGATEAFWLAIRGHIDLLTEARHWWDVVSGTIFPELPEGSEALAAAARDVLPPEPWDDTTWPVWRAAVSDAGPLRLMLTGEEDGPELEQLLPLIGRTRVLERLGGA